MGNKQDMMKRIAWMMSDRFGMFIHWGLYAIPARGEWVKQNERISNEEYQPYFDEFSPDEYDPKLWAKLAKEAGMKYAVMTSKHHDGFCLFDSKLTDYKSTNTKLKRDLIREYVNAFRAEGIKIGFYYSLLDWHHPDYPKYNDPIHPMRQNEAFKDEVINFDNYVKYMNGQVRELLTNYGKIDIMWFDFSYGEMSGEKWGAEELVSMARGLQPHLIIDNRLDGSGSIKDEEPLIYSGDFASPEQTIPASGLADNAGKPLPWEACITLNNNWGYASTDNNWKDASMIVRNLVECVSKGGNLLLNVGPDAKGRIPKPSIEILSEVGEWMSENAKSIYNCGKCDLEKPEWGYYTQNGKFIYAHIFASPVGPLAIKGLNGKIKKVRLLSDGSERKLNIPWNIGDRADSYVFVDIGFVDEFPNNPIDTVLEFELI